MEQFVEHKNGEYTYASIHPLSETPLFQRGTIQCMALLPPHYIPMCIYKTSLLDAYKPGLSLFYSSFFKQILMRKQYDRKHTAKRDPDLLSFSYRVKERPDRGLYIQR